MKSIRLNKGDISFDSLGKLHWVEDTNLIIQSLNLRLNTNLGDLFYNEDYGRPVFRGKITEENLKIFLKDVLLKDERVFDLDIISFERLSNGSINATMLVELNNGTEITIGYNI